MPAPKVNKNAEKVSLSKLKPNPSNPRDITTDELARLKDSINGFEKMLSIKPIIVDEDWQVLAGHQRIKALQALGYSEIQSDWIKQVTELTESEKKEFMVRDNVENGHWTFETFQEEYWQEEEWQEWIGQELPESEETHLEAEEDNFEIPDTIQTGIVLGDLFEIGEHRLLCGDSTDSEQVAKLMNGEKADMVFTDPPYGVDYSSQHIGVYSNGSNTIKSREVILNDNDTKSIIDFLPLLKTFCYGVAYVFCGAGKELDVLQSIKNNKYELINTLIWNKPKGTGALNANYKPCFEIFYYLKIQGDRQWSGNNTEWTVWDIEYKKDNTLHPTQKPIELISKAIDNHNSKSVLDFFLGSGSTMVASHQLKRKCYGMELDEKYCQVIVDRMLKLDETLTVKRNGEDVTDKMRERLL